jgi:hypothetical protein
MKTAMKKLLIAMALLAGAAPGAGYAQTLRIGMAAQDVGRLRAPAARLVVSQVA